MTAVTAAAPSQDGQLFASMSDDRSAKIFDVVNFGMSVNTSFGRFWLTFFNRHDQYDQARVYSIGLLLGPSKESSTISFGHVSTRLIKYTGCS